MYLGKSWSLPLRLDCDGLCASLQDLINILFAKFRAFIFLIHKRTVRSLPEKIFHLQLRQLLNLKDDGTGIRQHCLVKSKLKLAHILQKNHTILCSWVNRVFGQELVCHKDMPFHLWQICFLNSSLEEKVKSCGSLTPLRLPLRLMSCRTALSNPSFKLALSNISLSYEFRVIRRYTFTALLWPIRWQRAWACGIHNKRTIHVFLFF